MRHHLESRIAEQLKTDTAIIEFLIVWVADLLSKCKVHENGRATYEMNTQHIWKGKVIGFGEKVHYQFKIPANEKDTCSTAKTGLATPSASSAGTLSTLYRRRMESSLVQLLDE